MAIYRLEAKIISRGNGHSAVAAAAYRTGTKIRDERTERTHDYSNRTKGVVESVILRPDNSPEWTAKTATLWNAVERGEKRKDAQLSREFVLAVPKELSSKDQFRLAVGWAQSELVNLGMVAEVSLHDAKNGKNPHCHILTTLRTIEDGKFSAKKPREWNDKGLLIHWRESWGMAVNDALANAGRPERVDHRSLKDRGLDMQPQPKIGRAAVALKEKGVVEDPERFKAVRRVRLLNQVRPFIQAIRSHGEVRQHGVGATWWERSIIFTARVREHAGKAARNFWQKFTGVRREQDNNHSPQR